MSKLHSDNNATLANNTQAPNDMHMANNTKTMEFTQTPTNKGNATNAGNTEDSKATNTTGGNAKDASSATNAGNINKANNSLLFDLVSNMSMTLFVLLIFAGFCPIAAAAELDPFSDVTFKV